MQKLILKCKKEMLLPVNQPKINCPTLHTNFGPLRKRIERGKFIDKIRKKEQSQLIFCI